jgi:hypothetical protein
MKTTLVGARSLCLALIVSHSIPAPAAAAPSAPLITDVFAQAGQMWIDAAPKAGTIQKRTANERV